MGISFGLYLTLDSLIFNYAKEIYPTKIRDLALGIILGFSRLGGFIGQYTYVHIS